MTGGEASDYKSAADLLAMPVGKPRLMLADKGYDGDALRSELLLKGVLPVIPARANRKNPAKHDRTAYRDRNRIERMFSRLKQARRKVGGRLVDDGYLRPAKRVRSIVLLTKADRDHPFVDRQVMPPGAQMIRSAAAARSGVVVDRPASQPGTMEQARPC